MATIGNISINVTARTDGLRKNLRRGATQVNVFTGGIQNMGKGLVKLGAVVAAATLTIAGLRRGLSAISNQFGQVDNIAKTADRLGFATEELIAFRHAAQITAGVSESTFDMAMQRMTRRISEAAMGTGEAQGAIKELGLDAKALKLAGPAEAFRQIAQRIQGVSNQSDRVRLAFKLFDSEGAALVNTLRVGKEGLLGFEEEARKLGISLNRVDAAKIEMANDATTRLRAIFTGIARRIAVELAPFLDVAITKLVEFGTSGTGAAGIVRNGFNVVIGAIGNVLDAIDLMRDVWARLQLAVSQGFEMMVRGAAAVVRGFERAAELASQAFQSAFAFIFKLFAKAITWIESKLPERLQLGLGKVATEFSQAFGDTIKAGVDFNLGGESATNFADFFSADVRRLEKEFDKFVSRERLSDKLTKSVDEISRNAQKAAEEAAASATNLSAAADDVATSGGNVTPAALERGSQAAFSAFRKAQRGDRTEAEILAENRKMRKSLDVIARNPIILSIAPIGV